MAQSDSIPRPPARPLPLPGLFALLACAVLAWVWPAAADAQTPQLRLLATDQGTYDVPSRFGRMSGAMVNQAGDYLFSSGVSTGLFVRRAGAQAPVRVLQNGDALPGFPGSRVLSIESQRLNAAGHISIGAAFVDSASPFTLRGIVSFDGSTWRTIAHSGDVAPDPSGLVYGGIVTLIGMNDAGDVAFTGTLVPPGSVGATIRTTIFIAPAGGGPTVRIAGRYDEAPGTGGTFDTITAMAFNNQGEVLFRSTIVGGSGGAGLFLGSAGGVVKVAASGDANPAGGTFDTTTFPNALSTARLNNSGQVAFLFGSAFDVYDADTGLAIRVSLTTPPPADIGGSFTAIGPLAAFNDAADLAFQGNISGSAVTGTAVMRSVAGSPLQTVAYKTQAAPGTTSQTFNSFTNVSMSNAGTVAFSSALTGTPISQGIFKKTPAGSLVPVMLLGQSAPLAGGGTFGSLASPGMLPDDSVYFESEIYGGTADYGAFVAKDAATSALVSTADPLPAGARMSIRNSWLSGGGDYVGFTPRLAGGVFSIYVHNLATGATSRVMAEGDVAPGGKRMRLLNSNTVFVNAAGLVVFHASLGGAAAGLFTWTAASGVQTLVATDDTEPSSGNAFSTFTFPSLGPSPVGDGGHIAFRSALKPTGQGVFRATPGSTPVKIASLADAAPPSGTFTSFTGTPVVNESGAVAFLAGTSGGVTGLFYRAPGGALVKLAATGDVTAAGTIATLTVPLSISSGGEVVFGATLTGGSANGGVFVATAGNPLQAIAVGGAAAPAGGNYTFTSLPYDASINNQGDLLFRAELTGGSSDSGLFIRRGPSGPIEAVILQGAAAPGTTGVFGAVIATVNSVPGGECFKLGPTGEVLAALVNVIINGVSYQTSYRGRTDKTLEKVMVRGDATPDGGGGIVANFSQMPGRGGAGRFFIWTNTFGRDFADALYVTTARISLTDLRQTFNGTPRAVTVTTTPAGLAVTLSYAGTGGTIYGPSSAPPTGPGTYAVDATVDDGGATVARSATLSIMAAPLLGDFTGDLKSDVLWRGTSGGDVWLWPMDGAARTAETWVRTVPDPDWEIRAIADFDGDGKADLFWRHKVSGQLYYWPMDGTTALDEVYAGTVDPAYDMVGSGDFNGDGKADLLWRHTNLGDVWVWLMDGATPLSQVYIDRVDPAYVVKGVGDLDADGKADIVWHGASGDVWVWPMDGAARLDQVWVGTVPDPGYQIQGVADVDGNGKADLVWWHATRGEVWLWTMNGPTREAETWVGTVPDTSYQIAGTGDYNGDGKADLLWRNVVNGEVWMWLMNGPVRVSETWVATVPDTGYRIVR